MSGGPYVQLILEAALRRLDRLTPAQAGIYVKLFLLSAEGAGVIGPTTIVELADHLGVDRHTLGSAGKGRKGYLHTLAEAGVIDFDFPGASHEGWVEVLDFELLVASSVHSRRRLAKAIAKWKALGKRRETRHWPTLQRRETRHSPRGNAKAQSHISSTSTTILPSVVQLDARHAELRNGNEVEVVDIATGEVVERRPA